MTEHSQKIKTINKEIHRKESLGPLCWVAALCEAPKANVSECTDFIFIYWFYFFNFLFDILFTFSISVTNAAEKNQNTENINLTQIFVVVAFKVKLQPLLSDVNAADCNESVMEKVTPGEVKELFTLLDLTSVLFCVWKLLFYVSQRFHRTLMTCR